MEMRLFLSSGINAEYGVGECLMLYLCVTLKANNMGWIFGFSVLRCTESNGKIDLSLDGQVVHSMTFSKEQVGPINFPLTISQYFNKVGHHDFELSLSFDSSETSPHSMAYSLHIEQFANTPSNENSPLEMTTNLHANELTEGSSTSVNVHIKSGSVNNGVNRGMVVAVLPLPAALLPRYEKLQELVKTEKVSFFELNGNEVILYWRSMPLNNDININFDVTAEIPGHFVGKAARVYFYYSEPKFWTKGLRVDIN
eukprot:TRINITY_DN1460_c0_g2_i1.p1 TRINITY_DN1460_c0_g2~~TRINITY_DN1460_c0_g2_i1.p1  ORF type:complete len:255 (-),score=59.04 TRINITY_DN1460_c0_g2_i1:107-871(-)